LLSKAPELQPHEQQTLRAQVITELAPGSLLHDFAALLDFVATQELAATGKQQLLPLASLAALNARMAQPLQLNLKRALQKSYPHINGLFLLARATGLLRVVRRNDAAWLQLDEVALASWQTLNPTERYFTLLEAYLYHASVEMIGEHGRWLDMPGLQSDCLLIWKRISTQGIKVPPGKAQDRYFYSVWLFHYALLELFGLIRVTPGPVGKVWSINEIQPTPFGQALMTLVVGGAAEHLNRLLEEDEDEGEDEAEALVRSFTNSQALFQTYFSEWQRGYVLPEHEAFQPGVYQFKVSLGKIWRRIVIPAQATLEELSETILKSVRFDNDHLHCFEFKNRFGVTARINHGAMDEPPYSSEVCVGDLPIAPGDSLEYTFDFGDNWEFQLVLESIAPPDNKLKRARIIEARGQAPEQYRSWNEEW
jgi:hypothetical protein